MCFDWLHCNKCYFRFQPKINWYLSECYHIFCQMCMDKYSEVGGCIVCGQVNKKVVQLKKDLDPNLSMLFAPFGDLLKQVQEVYEFQMNHRSKLFQNLNQKYAYAKKECINYNAQLKMLSAENKKLKKALQDSRPFATSTPGTMETSQMDNASMVSSISNAQNAKPMQMYPGRAFRMMPTAQQRPLLRPNMFNRGSYRGTPGSSISALSSKLTTASIHRQPCRWPTSRNSLNMSNRP